MNERIKRLATLAGGEFYEGFLGSPNSIKFTEDELQKFAELIVERCLSMIENEAAQYAEPVWAVELVNDIKEHFGVEHGKSTLS